MYPATPTFWMEPTGQVEVGLRRYSFTPGSTLDCAGGHHKALRMIDRTQAKVNEKGYLEVIPMVDHADPRWPVGCEHCSYVFLDSDPWQMWQERVYRRIDTGEETTLKDAPVGAMWNADWMPSAREDGVYLMVRLPNRHDWAVDSQASNCTRKGQSHSCWVRHGDPREAKVTVDKQGNTCAAGAGSILSVDYHGFLRDGVLTAG